MILPHSIVVKFIGDMKKIKSFYYTWAEIQNSLRNERAPRQK